MAESSVEARAGLLGPNDPPPTRIYNADGASPFLLLGDHAGNRVPNALGDLGVSDAERARHIGWDIGIQALGEALADRLDAAFISQTYSRLVIDCNRDPNRADACPEVSDGTPIPANVGLSAADRQARVAAIHAPYQTAITEVLATRDMAGRATVLVSLHSFTPRMNEFDRPWQAGVLHDGSNDAFARLLLEVMQEDRALTIGDNEPYAMNGTDHTVPRHAFEDGRPYVELEIRQDLLAASDGPEAWSARLDQWLTGTLNVLSRHP
ncbi:N-formylglutamate amidohydrolase [Brevundimonas sp. Leaf363]|uniref:N-formylglutamate amidohydrolase n=1 Tax=Brevundimonas sp. Leaf363 TaxID=1736353 RepID=UPI0006F815E8|nr:N-formylglutamate amidohydrolase [Brevundimonas sp. Leaf363]KQS55826.1 N-formylglutamate amidohydrolase [Brevundimonas sp. Leaf363]